MGNQRNCGTGSPVVWACLYRDFAGELGGTPGATGPCHLALAGRLMHLLRRLARRVQSRVNVADLAGVRREIRYRHSQTAAEPVPVSLGRTSRVLLACDGKFGTGTAKRRLSQSRFPSGAYRAGRTSRVLLARDGEFGTGTADGGRASPGSPWFFRTRCRARSTAAVALAFGALDHLDHGALRVLDHGEPSD